MPALTADPWEMTIALAAGGGFAVSAMVAFYRLVMLPQLQRDLFEPVRETHVQVTRNHHSNRERPTVLDAVDDVKTEVHALREDLSEAMRVQTEHIAWADTEVSRIWRAIGRKADRSS